MSGRAAWDAACSVAAWRGGLSRPQLPRHSAPLTPSAAFVPERLPWETRAGTCRPHRLETGAARGGRVMTVYVGLRRARTRVVQPRTARAALAFAALTPHGMSVASRLRAYRLDRHSTSATAEAGPCPPVRLACAHERLRCVGRCPQRRDVAWRPAVPSAAASRRARATGGSIRACAAPVPVRTAFTASRP